ncbi:MAG: manganese efflux pump MntP family protein [Oscillospiraceae bacterium]|nr:manganese efflux pump MntP family protein [Oscillospiraceae bacterium]
MELLQAFMIGLGLAMDAAAVSVSNALISGRNKKIALQSALSFAAAQGLMPLAGYFLGVSFAGYVKAFDHWIAFVLLAAIGGNMILEAVREIRGSSSNEEKTVSFKTILFQALATSIDALAVGVSFAFLNRGNIFLSCLIISLVTLALSLAASFAGSRLGVLFKEKAEIIGGIILLLIGLKILIEHVAAGK